MMKRYIVISIGCLECGNSSDVLGVYVTQAEAEATGAEARALLIDDRDWIGESMRVWFEIDVPAP